MTLNNRKPISSGQDKSLLTLSAAVTGLSLDYPDHVHWPVNPRFEERVSRSSAKVPLLYPACGFYFDIAPGREYPNVNIQLPLYVYGTGRRRIGNRSCTIDKRQWKRASLLINSSKRCRG
ncbi:hypothetical protein GGS20DRAFT_564453 [Poronia punctata]|nr:hypothetical protein GGS20DRAFT_564453 [Poronia punctata]